MTEIKKPTQIQYYLALFYCLVVGVIFAYHYFAAKEVMQSIGPLPLSAVRGIVGGLFLFALFHKKIKYFTFDLFKKVVVVAILGFFINQIFFMVGLTKTQPLNAAIINNTIPIFTSLMAIIFGLEAFRYRKIIGIFLGFALVILLAILGSSSGFTGINTGDLYIFFNVISLSISFVYVKKIINDKTPHEMISAGMIFLGGIMLSLICFKEIPAVFEYTFQSNWTLWLMFFEVILSTAVVYWLNFKALQTLDSSVMTIFIYLQPILAASFEYFLFGSTPKPINYIIFLGIIVSGYLVVKKDKVKDENN
ncbi:MAG: DMT family transporter [Bacteriovoracaceae bacterium]